MSEEIGPKSFDKFYTILFWINLTLSSLQNFCHRFLHSSRPQEDHRSRSSNGNTPCKSEEKNSIINKEKIINEIFQSLRFLDLKFLLLLSAYPLYQTIIK